MRGQKLEILKRSKNREDVLDFDEIRTKKIAATQAVSRKKNWTIETNEKFPKNSKNYQKHFRKILKIDTADVINC